MDNKEKIQPGSGDKAKAGPNAYGQGRNIQLIKRFKYKLDFFS